MKVYIKSYKGVLLTIALIICVSLLANISKFSVNQRHKEFCEEDLIDIIEPREVEDKRMT